MLLLLLGPICLRCDIVVLIGLLNDVTVKALLLPAILLNDYAM